MKRRIDVGDAIALPYPKNFFDVVISVQTFPYVPHSLQALKEVYRVLAKDGTALIHFPQDYLHVEKTPELLQKNVAASLSNRRLNFSRLVRPLDSQSAVKTIYISRIAASGKRVIEPVVRLDKRLKNDELKLLVNYAGISQPYPDNPNDLRVRSHYIMKPATGKPL